jgi:hypothetical protein
MTTPDSPSKGLATYVGLALTFLAAAPVWIGELAGATEPLGVPSSTWVTVTLVIGALTVFGRMLQAALGIYAAWRDGGTGQPNPVPPSDPGDHGDQGDQPILPSD